MVRLHPASPGCNKRKNERKNKCESKRTNPHANKTTKELITMPLEPSSSTHSETEQSGVHQHFQHLTGPGQGKWRLPSAILLFGILVCSLLIFTKSDPPKGERERLAPLHRIQRVQAESILLTVSTNGTVAPRTQSDLVPEVSGTVIWVSPSFVSGGFFEEGEVLLQIDPRDYEAELEGARANLARRESESSHASKELKRHQRLAKQNISSATQLDDASNRNKIAEAELRSAQADLARAERNVERTALKAPFTGRVREEMLGVGQYVDRSKVIGRLYSVDMAEVRLPIPDDQLAFLDLPLRDGVIPENEQADVRLTAVFAGKTHTWWGNVVRTEGEIDPKSRMVHVIAQVIDPYGRKLLNPVGAARRPPLAVGLFVAADISGLQVENVFILPRSALRDNERVVTVDAENRLRLRKVNVLRTQYDSIIIDAGLNSGDRVVISDLDIVVEGMKIRVVPDAAKPGKHDVSGAKPTESAEEQGT